MASPQNPPETPVLPAAPDTPAAAAPQLSIEDRLGALFEAEEGGPPVQETPEPTTAPEAAPAEEEPIAAPESPDSDGSEEAEPEVEEGAEPAGDDAPIETTADLATAMELDEADLLTHLNVDLDGTKVPLAEVIEGYKNRDAPMLPADVEVLKSQYTTAQATLEAGYEQRILELAGVTKAVMDRLETDSLSPEEMRALEKEDPQDFVLRKLRMDADKGALNAAVAELRNEEARHGQMEQQQAEQFRQAEMAKVPIRIPEWKDREVAGKEVQYIQDYLRTQDFQDADFSILNDSRYIAVARDAMLYRKLMDGKKLTMKKVKRTPKRVAASARNENAQEEQVVKKHQALIDKAKRTGRLEDAAARIGGLGQ